jgi:UDP-N-acetylmuramoyl-L-alanyl-D-glutamate--2,6-diaminopimelate ligase
MKLNELLAGFCETTNELPVAGLSLDSRSIKTGEVFIALPEAAEYIPQVLKNGASAVIFDAKINLSSFKDLKGFESFPFIAVENLADKLAEIAARYYDYPSRYLDIIGITGTNGKTSCSQFLAQVLTDSMVIGTLGWGTWGNLQTTGFTTPTALTLQKILAEAVALNQKNVVMEVSSHGIQQKRIEQTLFKGAVFTNLSRDHLDYHGTMEAYFQVKLQLFQRPELQFAVINGDDSYGQRIIAELNSKVKLWQFRTGSPSKDCQSCVQAKNLICTAKGSEFDVIYNNETAHIESCLYGKFNIENILAVLTTLLAMNFTLTEAIAKIAQLKPVVGRLEYYGGQGKPAVFVDYAHTPDALENVLQSLTEHRPSSLTVVFGCGGNRDQGKRALMGAIAEKYADSVIITDDNPRFEDGEAIVLDILRGCASDKIRIIRDRTQAIQTAVSQADKYDCIVIAGKGHEDYQEINGAKNPFSDQLVVQQALENWREWSWD